MEPESDVTQKPSIPSGMGVIEKVQELRWTLQFTAAVMFADLVLVWRTKHGISQWSASADQLLANSGFLVTSVLAFAVLMSIVMPLAGELFRQMVWELMINIPRPNWTVNERDYRRPVGKVRPEELHEHALRKGDKFLLDIYTAHRQRKSAQEAAEIAVAQIAFALLVLGCVNYFAGELGFQGATLLQSLVDLLGWVGELIVMLGLILVIVVLKSVWFSINTADWIYYPPLYEEIDAEREDRCYYR